MKRRCNTVLAGWFVLALATLLPLAAALAQAPAAPKGGDSGSTDILNVGERIVVILSDIPNGPPPQEVVISEDGKITLHLDKTFSAAGKTRSQLEKEIKEYYVPNFYTRMTVTVKQEERFVYVGGFVKSPNR